MLCADQGLEIMLNTEPVPGTLAVRKKYTLDTIHTLKHLVQLRQACFLEVGNKLLENLKEMHTENMHNNPTQTTPKI